MRLDLYALAALVARSLYRQLDDWSGPDYRSFYAENVYGTSAQSDAAEVVAWEEGAGKWYRIPYTLGVEDGTRTVVFADETEWEQVEWEWVPVTGEPSGDAERAFAPMQHRKMALLTAAEERVGSTGSSLGALQTRAGNDPASPDALGVHRTRAVTFEVRRDEEARSTTLVINTGAVDGHRTIVDPSGAEWDEFRGRFFINHDLGLLAGFSPEPSLRNGNWEVTISDDDWDHEDPEVERWYRKVKSGLCREASLGFVPLDGVWENHDVHGRTERVFRFTRWKGKEWSFVGMASNGEAVVTERAAATRAVQRGSDIRERAGAAQPVQAEPTPASSAEVTPEPVPVRQLTPTQIREAAEARKQRLRRAALQRRGQA